MRRHQLLTRDRPGACQARLEEGDFDAEKRILSFEGRGKYFVVTTLLRDVIN